MWCPSTTAAGSFPADQRQYPEGIPALNISRDCRQQNHDPTTDQEKSQLRRLYGVLSRHTGQVGFKYSAHAGLGLSEIPHSTVEHLEQANKRLLQVKQDSRIPLRIHSFPETAASSSICQGAVPKVSRMFWRSRKIDRTCRSPGAAEAGATMMQRTLRISFAMLGPSSAIM